MKPSEIFALIVRCLGLALALEGIFQFYQAVIYIQLSTFVAWVQHLFGVATFLIGLWFLRGAPWMISFCYGQEPSKE